MVWLFLLLSFDDSNANPLDPLDEIQINFFCLLLDWRVIDSPSSTDSICSVGDFLVARISFRFRQSGRHPIP